MIFPDPLRLADGDPVRTADEWRDRRRPELLRLFRHFMYGFAPPPPEVVSGVEIERDEGFLGGRAVRKRMRVAFDPVGSPGLDLLCVLPRGRPAPVLLGLSFGGHAEVLAPASPDHRHVWDLAAAIDRGIGVASCHCADIDPDRDDFTDGVHPWFRAPGATGRGMHEWGTLAAWAWGLGRAADWLENDPEVDGARLGVFGHSRLGKAALWAAATDERFSLVIANQSGCGGAAPSRTTVGETVAQINGGFPHWFALAFRAFNDRPERLPFDQHALIALVAPRAVLLNNAVEDEWANPRGQFDMLRLADPVWRLLGTEGLRGTAMPEPGRLLDGTLAYRIRPGAHSVTADDWAAFLAFAAARWA